MLVCGLGLWEPFIAYNFLYRKPQRGIEHLMRYFVGEELGIALMLQRHFDWSSNILWAEESVCHLAPCLHETALATC